MELKPTKKLATCSHGQQFYAANGHEFWSLYDLARGLQQMDEGTFGHHVNTDRNDFHNWVGDVVGDHTLAQGLLHLHDRDSMMRRVVLRIRFLELMKDSASALTRARRAPAKKAPARKKASTSKKKVAKKAPARKKLRRLRRRFPRKHLRERKHQLLKRKQPSEQLVKNNCAV